MKKLALYRSGWTFVSQYGWFLLMGLAVVIFLWYKFQDKYYAWKKRRDERLEEQNFGKS